LNAHAHGRRATLIDSGHAFRVVTMDVSLAAITVETDEERFPAELDARSPGVVPPDRSLDGLERTFTYENVISLYPGGNWIIGDFHDERLAAGEEETAWPYVLAASSPPRWRRAAVRSRPSCGRGRRWTEGPMRLRGLPPVPGRRLRLRRATAPRPTTNRRPCAHPGSRRRPAPRRRRRAGRA
jgi:hypothetical protein